jgi:hypothetical protein
MQRSWAAATVAGLVLATTPAHADPTVAECVDAFENAQRAQKNGHLVFAGKLFQECLVPACPKEVRNDCTAGQVSVDRSIATVTIVVRNAAGADVPSTIKIDGAPVSGAPGHAMPIDPGTHQLQYTVGGDTKLSNVTIVEGEKSRVIVLPASEPTSEAPKAATPPAASPPPSAEAPSNGSIVGPAIAGGLGVLALVAGVGAFVLSANEASDRDEQRAIANDTTKSPATRNASDVSANTHDNASSTDRSIGIGLAVGGFVLIGSAAAWYVFTRSSSKKSARFSPVITF